MFDNDTPFDDIKRKIRKLKRLEEKIWSCGYNNVPKNLVWDSFFDLSENGGKNKKYTLKALVLMTKEEYKNTIDEYFARVYYEAYKINTREYVLNLYDPEILTSLGLPISADEQDIKKKFRELAKKYHPDTGGDSEMFVNLIENYRKLTDKK